MSRASAPMLACCLASALAFAVMPLGCGGDETEEPFVPSSPATPVEPAASRRGDAGAAAMAPDLPPLPLREFQESDFSETDRSRDPFRGFASLFTAQAKGRVVRQRQVLIDRYALDELKLVGVVSRGESRALLTDPTGLGWVVKVGDFIGKAEIVHSGGPTGADVAINWRIDRIRDSDVVFLREDPSHPEIPPSTRVLGLRVPETTPGQGATPAVP